MKQSINNYDFHNAFNSMRPNNFTYEGLNALFEWLEQYEEDTGEQIELDVIGLCCEFTENSLSNVLEDYGLDTLEGLQNKTMVIKLDEDNIIYQNY